jgi:uncharacterized protein YkwD
LKKKGIIFLTVLLIVSLTILLVPSNAFASNRSNVSAFVTRFYNTCLDRGPDPAGLNGWTDYLMSGQMSGAQVARGFIFSPEFISKKVTNERFLNIMYYAFFNRAPDPVGYSGWLNSLRQGRSREFVFHGFINSQEFANLCSRYGIRSGSITQSTNISSPNISSLTAVEAEILTILNAHRANSRVPALGATHALNSAARTRSSDMITRNYFSHVCPSGTNFTTLLRSSSITYSAAAENIYQASPPSNGTAAAAISTWLASPGHRANMLNSNYSKVGIGVSENSSRRVITLIFTN